MQTLDDLSVSRSLLVHQKKPFHVNRLLQGTVPSFLYQFGDRICCRFRIWGSWGSFQSFERGMDFADFGHDNCGHVQRV